jgi:hypothetical protein
LSFCGDWNALVAFLEQFSCRVAPLVSELGVCLGKALNESCELPVFASRHKQVYVVVHLHCRVDRDSVLSTGFRESKDKELVLAWVREEPTAIVSAKDDVVGMTG